MLFLSELGKIRHRIFLRKYVEFHRELFELRIFVGNANKILPPPSFHVYFPTCVTSGVIKRLPHSAVSVWFS